MMLNEIKTLFNNKIIRLGILLLIPSLSQAVQTFNYEDDHFSVTLPKGWIVIPTYLVESAVRVAQQFAPMIPTQQYHYGFQWHTAGGWFKSPYILIGVKKNGKFPISQLEKTVDFQNIKELKDVKNILKTLVGEVHMSGVSYEPSSRIIWLRVDTETVDDNSMSSIYGIILTEQGAIQLTGFVKRMEFNEFFPLFEQIIRSVKITQAVSATPSSLPPPPSVYPPWQFFIVGIAIIVIVGLIILFRIKKYNKTKSLPKEETTSIPVLAADVTMPEKIEQTPPLVTQEVTLNNPVNPPVNPMYALISPKSQNYYEILGVNYQASEAEIKGAAQTKLKELKTELAALGAHEKSFYGKIAKAKGDRIKKAFQTLAHPERRRRYDLELQQIQKQLLEKLDNPNQNSQNI